MERLGDDATMDALGGEKTKKRWPVLMSLEKTQLIFEKCASPNCNSRYMGVAVDKVLTRRSWIVATPSGINNILSRDASSLKCPTTSPPLKFTSVVSCLCLDTPVNRKLLYYWFGLIWGNCESQTPDTARLLNLYLTNLEIMAKCLALDVLNSSLFAKSTVDLPSKSS